MAEAKEAQKKALVLKAFDTLFNKSPYAAALDYGARGHRRSASELCPDVIDVLSSWTTSAVRQRRWRHAQRSTRARTSA